MATDPSGWMPGVTQMRTSSWGYTGFPEDGMFPQAVVSHVAQGYFNGLVNIAKSNDPSKSWHFSVARDGTIAQHVSIWDPAYHAGIVADPQPLASALIGQYGTNPNRWSVGIEQEGFSVNPGYAFDYLYDVDSPWPEPQIASVIRIHQWVFQAGEWLANLSPAEREKRLLTHSMIDQRTRRQDPGDLWIASVRPRIVEALAPQSAPEPAQDEYERGKQDGRGEMREAWEREDTRLAGEWIAFVRSRREAWGVNR